MALSLSQEEAAKEVCLNPMLTLLLPEAIMETCGLVLTCESVSRILWCDHSNETSSAVLLHGTICCAIFYKIIFDVS